MTPTEINEAVADKLIPGNKFRGAGGYGYAGPNYCTSIEAAWEVVFSLGRGFSISREKNNEWVCSFIKKDQMWVGKSDTAEMAICLAFLKLP